LGDRRLLFCGIVGTFGAAAHQQEEARNYKVKNTHYMEVDKFLNNSKLNIIKEGQRTNSLGI
jgi:hypothetical protein